MKAPLAATVSTLLEHQLSAGIAPVVRTGATHFERRVLDQAPLQSQPSRFEHKRDKLLLSPS